MPYETKKKNLTEKEITKLLESIYYDKGFYVGADYLYKIAHKENPNIRRSEVRKFIENQYLYQMTKPPRKTKELARFFSKGPLNIVQIDCISKPYVKMFCIIDIFSRYAFAYKIPKINGTIIIKQMERAMNAYKKISSRPIRMVMSDNGPEFKNKTFKNFAKEHNIKLMYGIAQNPNNQAIVEVFNKTIMKLLTRYRISHNQIALTQPIINKELRAYNKSFNRMIGMTPEDAIKPENLEEVLQTIQKNQRIPKQKTKEATKKTKVYYTKSNTSRILDTGDKVRLKLIDDSKISRRETYWTEEVFTIQSIVLSRKNPGNPIKYKVMDKKREPLKGYFHRNDLQKINKVLNKDKVHLHYTIEKLVKRIKVGKRIKFLVKWRNHPHSENTEEFRSSLMKDVPNLVKEFEKKNINS